MKIVLLGSGNVAYHLGKVLNSLNFEIIQVYNKHEKSGKELAKLLSAEYVNDFNLINKNADLYIISVIDDFLPIVVKNLEINSGIVVHTSGTKKINELNKFENYGVFYPLQTFSKNIDLNYKEIPFLLEANTQENFEFLKNIALKISKNVVKTTGEKRKILHISAVFSCNFTNFMFSCSEEILENENLSFDLLKPLIKETIRKIENESPKNTQTGPAVRKDRNVIKEHLQYLEKYPDLKEIYEILSNKIEKLLI